VTGYWDLSSEYGSCSFFFFFDVTTEGVKAVYERTL
jgi:hypothetical protein